MENDINFDLTTAFFNDTFNPMTFEKYYQKIGKLTIEEILKIAEFKKYALDSFDFSMNFYNISPDRIRTFAFCSEVGSKFMPDFFYSTMKILLAVGENERHNNNIYYYPIHGSQYQDLLAYNLTVLIKNYVLSAITFGEDKITFEKVLILLHILLQATGGKGLLKDYIVFNDTNKILLFIKSITINNNIKNIRKIYRECKEIIQSNLHKEYINYKLSTIFNNALRFVHKDRPEDLFHNEMYLKLNVLSKEYVGPLSKLVDSYVIAKP